MLGKLGSKLVFFEKHFISYSCILFIKFNALRIFCKNLFFPEFRSIEPIFRSIKIVIKNFGYPFSVSIDARLILDQSKNFQSIKPKFRSIENRIESFFKNLILTCSTYFSKSFLTLSLSLFDQSRLQSNFFVVFLQFFCKVFLL